MKRIAFYSLTPVAAYLMSWLGGYIFVMGVDFHLVEEYFTYSWTGGGEIPAFIQLVALGAALVVTFLSGVFDFLISRKRSA